MRVCACALGGLILFKRLITIRMSEICNRIVANPMQRGPPAGTLPCTMDELVLMSFMINDRTPAGMVDGKSMHTLTHSQLHAHGSTGNTQA